MGARSAVVVAADLGGRPDDDGAVGTRPLRLPVPSLRRRRSRARSSPSRPSRPPTSPRRRAWRGIARIPGGGFATRPARWRRDDDDGGRQTIPDRLPREWMRDDPLLPGGGNDDDEPAARGEELLLPAGTDALLLLLPDDDDASWPD